MGDVHPLASARVLTNADLLHGIFTFVPWASEDRDSYLAQCATVCRTFHEPVIRVLWRNLDALLPLWHLLAPSNTPFPYNGGVDDELLRYLQTVNSAQLYLDSIRWDRFLWHAAYIRGIRHRTHASQAIEDSNRLLIQAVIMQNGGSTVLPLLRTIRWLASDSSRDGALIPFFTSTLRHASFTTESGDAASGLFLRRLRELSLLLENISFDHPGPSVVQALLHFPRLHQVWIFRISQPEPFEATITKPNLTFFRVHEVIGPWADPGRAVSVRDLRVLVVAGAARALSGLFRLVRFQALKRANIHVVGFSQIHLETTDIMTLLGLFYNAVSTSGLQSIDLALLGSPPPSPDLTFPALRDLLAPILPLSDLRSFNLVGMLTVTSLDDADFEALARAWPKLESLRLHHGFTRECGVWIGALHDLSRRCPDLRELSVPGLRYPIIGVHDIPTPPHRSPSHPLRHLTVRTLSFPKTSPPYISDETAEALARYLLDLFPSLDGWKYKPAPPREEPPEPSPEPPGRRPFDPSLYVTVDPRWWKIARNIYAICSAREEL